jgi:hypothetical protein
MRTYVGIDPGMTGGIARITEGKLDLSIATPILNKEFDDIAIYTLLFPLRGTDCRVILEKVHSNPTFGAKGNFTFGGVYGSLRTILHVLQLPYVTVSPKTWQKEVFSGMKEIRKPPKTRVVKGKEITVQGSIDTKLMARQACNRIWPTFDFTPTPRSKKPHEGMIDSALIAEYGRRKNL